MKSYGWSYLVVLFLIVVGVASWSVYKDNNSTIVSGPGPTFAPGIGGGPGDLVSGTSSADISPIRTRFQTILTDHGSFTVDYLKDLYDGKDTSSDEQSLSNNSQDLKNAIAAIGGVQSGDEFLTMWQGHITEYANYTKALKENDEIGMAQAKTALSNQAIQMGDMVHQLIPTLTAVQVAHLMNEHIDLTLNIIGDYANKDTESESAHETQASAQAVNFANTLSDGIENSPLK